MVLALQVLCLKVREKSIYYLTEFSVICHSDLKMVCLNLSEMRREISNMLVCAFQIQSDLDPLFGLDLYSSKLENKFKVKGLTLYPY